jgi:hypothetical protein
VIDTVSLLIPKDKVTMNQTPKNGAPKWELYSKTEQYDKYVKNPSKQNIDSGLYYPRLTGYRRNHGQDASVRIEFSVPKLLYQNNLDELQDKDFTAVITLLQARLKEMGVLIKQDVLKDAPVSSVHFSKNLQLEDGYTVNHLISEMNKVNLRKSFDMTRTRYINDGQSLYAHATSHQLVIYDKVADLSKDKKRAIDKDQTLYQKNLFSELNNDPEAKEIIRFEIRLSNRQKMKKLFVQLGYTDNPTFKDVFSEEISKGVVNEYWKKLIRDRNLGMFSISIGIKDILRTLFLADEKIKPKQAIYFTGLFLLGKDENGMRELRSIVSKKSHERTWYRITKDMQQATQLITKNKLRDWVTQIDKGLENYKPYKTKNYENNKNN